MDHDFHQWRQTNESPVAVTSFRTIPNLMTMLEPILKTKRIQLNTCYDNAMLLCRLIPDCHYVLGRVEGDGRLVDHAWNEWMGYHFDVTRELIGVEVIRDFKWTMNKRISREDLCRLVEFGVAPTIYDIFFEMKATGS